MYQKFIINQNGVLKFGHVYLHRELLDVDELCPYGGGVWAIDESRHCILLYGRSFDLVSPILMLLSALIGVGSGDIPSH